MAKQQVRKTAVRKTTTKVARSEKAVLDSHVILGLHVHDRAHRASGVQAVLSEFGENIKSRLGLHDVHDGFCSPNGLILLEFVGSDAICEKMVVRLGALQGVEVKRMVFHHS